MPGPLAPLVAVPTIGTKIAAWWGGLGLFSQVTWGLTASSLGGGVISSWLNDWFGDDVDDEIVKELNEIGAGTLEPANASEALQKMLMDAGKDLNSQFEAGGLGENSTPDDMYRVMQANRAVNQSKMDEFKVQEAGRENEMRQKKHDEDMRSFETPSQLQSLDMPHRDQVSNREGLQDIRREEDLVRNQYDRMHGAGAFNQLHPTQRAEETQKWFRENTLNSTPQSLGEAYGGQRAKNRQRYDNDQSNYDRQIQEMLIARDKANPGSVSNIDEIKAKYGRGSYIPSIDQPAPKPEGEPEGKPAGDPAGANKSLDAPTGDQMVRKKATGVDYGAMLMDRFGDKSPQSIEDALKGEISTGKKKTEKLTEESEAMEKGGSNYKTGYGHKGSAGNSANASLKYLKTRPGEIAIELEEIEGRQNTRNSLLKELWKNYPKLEEDEPHYKKGPKGPEGDQGVRMGALQSEPPPLETINSFDMDRMDSGEAPASTIDRNQPVSLDLPAEHVATGPRGATAKDQAYLNQAPAIRPEEEGSEFFDPREDDEVIRDIRKGFKPSKFDYSPLVTRVGNPADGILPPIGSPEADAMVRRTPDMSKNFPQSEEAPAPAPAPVNRFKDGPVDQSTMSPEQLAYNSGQPAVDPNAPVVPDALSGEGGAPQVLPPLPEEPMPEEPMPEDQNRTIVPLSPGLAEEFPADTDVLPPIDGPQLPPPPDLSGNFPQGAPAPESPDQIPGVLPPIDGQQLPPPPDLSGNFPPAPPAPPSPPEPAGGLEEPVPEGEFHTGAEKEAFAGPPPEHPFEANAPVEPSPINEGLPAAYKDTVSQVPAPEGGSEADFQDFPAIPGYETLPELPESPEVAGLVPDSLEEGGLPASDPFTESPEGVTINEPGKHPSMPAPPSSQIPQRPPQATSRFKEIPSPANTLSEQRYWDALTKYYSDPANYQQYLDQYNDGIRSHGPFSQPARMKGWKEQAGGGTMVQEAADQFGVPTGYRYTGAPGQYKAHRNGLPILRPLREMKDWQMEMNQHHWKGDEDKRSPMQFLRQQKWNEAFGAPGRQLSPREFGRRDMKFNRLASELEGMLKEQAERTPEQVANPFGGAPAPAPRPAARPQARARASLDQPMSGNYADQFEKNYALAEEMDDIGFHEGFTDQPWDNRLGLFRGKGGKYWGVDGEIVPPQVSPIQADIMRTQRHLDNATEIANQIKREAGIRNKIANNLSI